MRHAYALVAVMLLGLAGCATAPSYGNFAAATQAMDQTMANDAVTQLSDLYPPAKTHLALQQPTPDAFGAALVSALRVKGYAVQEFDPPAASSTAAAPATSTSAVPNVDLRYVLDAPATTNLYRVTVMVGQQSITRAYAVTRDGNVAPAGAWARKE